MLNGKAGGGPVCDPGFHADYIAVGGGNKKIAACLYERNPHDLESLEHFCLGEAKRAMKQGIGACVKIFKIMREKDNSKGVAVTPLYKNLFSMN